MAGKRISKAIVGVGKETTAYTYLEPGNADAYAAFDITLDYGGDNYQRREAKAHMGKLPELSGAADVTIGFKLTAVGASAAGTAPYYGTALLGCGLRQEITSATKVEYKPWSTFDAATAAGPPATTNPAASYTVAIWEEGLQYALKGGQGNLKISAKSGEPAILEFLFKGGYVAPATDATPPTVTLSTLVPPKFLSAALTIGGTSIVFTDFTLDLGGDLQPSVNANDAAGIRGYYIADRRIVATVNPEMEDPATIDFFANWRAGTVVALVWGPIGSVAGNKIDFAATSVQLRPPKVGDRGGIRSLDIELAVITTGAEGTDFTLKYT